jgi:superoxide dismutase, Cu-Zn family
MRRRTLTSLFASSLVAAAIAYGCSYEALPPPPELDAASPNQPPREGGGGSGGGSDASTDAPGTAPYNALAMLAPTGLADAGSVTGTVTFAESNGVVAISVVVSGATPGSHGMHIHEGSSCAATDAGPAGAAGDHWNPTGTTHGLPDSGAHHVGDFGNITIGSDGTGTLSLDATGFNVQPDGGALSALGKTVVFHQGADNGTTQPTGNSGAHAGCGPIEAR